MERPDWLMLFPDHYTWSSAVLSAIASSMWGGSDIGEIYRVVAALQDRVGDGSAWFSEWERMAERVAALGEQAERAGHTETASAAFMRAAHYLQIGERLLQPRTGKSQSAYARSVALFRRGLTHVPYHAVDCVEVPFEGGKSLPAYFVRRDSPAPVGWPTVVFFDGLDITKEMCVFRGTFELTKRGMACLVIDGPGNGESVRFRGIHLRHDYETAGTAAADYLVSRDDVDTDRLAVMGVSLGGFYAPRCAAFEKRFKACVAWGAIWDYHATWKRRIEAQFKTALSVPGEHIKWILGVESYEEALQKLEKFPLKGVASRIACSFLLTHGEADAQVSTEEARKLFDEVGSKDKTFKLFTREEGGSQHCQRDNQTLGVSYIADWLADRLVRNG